MKLNHECVRSILLTVEECDNPNQKFSPEILKNSNRFDEFETEEIRYAIQKLFEAGFVNVMRVQDPAVIGGEYFVDSITWSGHEFLDNIRNESAWNQVMEALKENSISASLSIVGKFVSGIVDSGVKKITESFFS